LIDTSHADIVARPVSSTDHVLIDGRSAFFSEAQLIMHYLNHIFWLQFPYYGLHDSEHRNRTGHRKTRMEETRSHGAAELERHCCHGYQSPFNMTTS
jgi:hypothetical protein